MAKFGELVRDLCRNPAPALHPPPSAIFSLYGLTYYLPKSSPLTSAKRQEGARRSGWTAALPQPQARQPIGRCPMATSFTSLTSGCHFGAKQREQQRKHFQGKAAAESSRESALGSIDFFNEATTSAPTEDAESAAVPTSRAARRRRARKALEAEAEAAAQAEPRALPDAPKPAQAIHAEMSEREVADANALRRAMRIHAYGTELPAPVQSATDMADRFGLRPALRRNVLSAGYHELTRVQMQAVPSMMARRDVVACAPTGSGKTAAFAIPLIAQLGAPKREGLRAVIVAPTQELAAPTLALTLTPTLILTRTPAPTLTLTLTPTPTLTLTLTLTRRRSSPRRRTARCSSSRRASRSEWACSRRSWRPPLPPRAAARRCAGTMRSCARRCGWCTSSRRRASRCTR